MTTGSDPDTADRINQWLRDVALARAERSVDVPGGFVVLHGDYPMAHDHNRMFLWSDVDAATAVGSADVVLGGAGLQHRLIDVQTVALADQLEAGLKAAGYSRSNNLLMRYDGGDPLPGGPIAVTERDLTQRVAAAKASWRTEQPGWPDETVRQLGERTRTLASGVDATFLAVLGAQGVASRADLYMRDGVAQIDDVFTEPAERNQGFAAALVRECITRARSSGAELIFLVADADDWPAQLYRRIGFTDLHAMTSFSR